jgi:hypothetical protein
MHFVFVEYLREGCLNLQISAITITINLTEADKKDLPRQANHPPRSKGHSKSILTEAVQMPASVNQIKNNKKKKENPWTSPASPSTGRRRSSCSPV